MKKWTVRILYFLGSIFMLIFVFIMVLQTNWAKNLIRSKLQSYISNKTKTEFVIRSLNYSLPEWIELDGVLMRDHHKDTLFYGGKINAHLAMLQLIRGRYQFNKITLDNIFINLVRQKRDSVFNYQFVIDAFNTPSSTPKNKKDSSSLNLTVRELIIQHTRFNQLDYHDGSLISAGIADFHLQLNKLDLDKMDLDIKNLYADNLHINMQILQLQPETPSNKQSSWPHLNADNLVIQNSSLVFENRPAQLISNNQIGLFQVIKLNNNKDVPIFKGHSINLANSVILFQQANSSKKDITNSGDKLQAKKGPVQEEPGFSVDEINFSNNTIIYNDKNKPVKTTGLDYYHLGITGLFLSAKNSEYGGGKLRSSVSQFSFADKSGFRLDTLKGELAMDTAGFYLKKISIRTANSSIRAEAVVYPSSFTTPPNKQGKLPDNTILLTNTIIGRKDLDLLADGLTSKYKNELDESGDILLNIKIAGNARRLVISRLEASSVIPGRFNLQLAGIVRNATDKKNIQYDILLKNLFTSGNFLSVFVNRMQQKINLPPVIAVSGTLKGSMQQITADLTTHSAYGIAVVKGEIDHFTKPAGMGYDLFLKATDLETGKWIYRDSLLGKITGIITVKGANGLDIKKNSMKVSANVVSFRLQQHIIKNIRADASSLNGIAEAITSVNDTLLNFSLHGKGNIKNEYPTVDASLDLKHADPMALGVSKDIRNISAHAQINIKNATPKNLYAFFRIDSTHIDNGPQKISIDSLIVLAEGRNDSTVVHVSSPFEEADFKSNLYYNDLPSLVQQVMDQFIPPAATRENDKNVAEKGKKKKTAPKGSLQADIIIKPSEAYASFIKNTSLDQPVTIRANITNTSKDSSLSVLMNIPGLQVNALRVGNLKGTLVGQGDSLKLMVNIDTVKTGAIPLFGVILKGSYSKNNLSAFVSAKDENKKEWFQLSAIGGQDKNENYFVQLGQDLLLNYQKWQVNKENKMRYAKGDLNIQNFDLDNRSQKIAVQSESEEPNAPMSVDIDDFKISNITSLLNKDSSSIEGMLNVSLKATNLAAVPSLNGYLEIDSLVYNRHLAGNLYLQAKAENNQVTLKGKIDGNGNNVAITGDYNQNKIDVKINLDPLVLTSIEPFTQGNLARSSGNVKGDLNITGSVSDPKWNGDLSFDKVQTSAAATGTFIKIDNQKISLNYPTVSFNGFTISDSANNTFKFDGTITQKPGMNFISDLTLAAKNFKVLNNTAINNNMLYGQSSVDLDATIKGSVTAPNISGKITVKNGTNITYVSQSSPASAKDREGIIEFVDMDTIPNLLTAKTREEVLAIQKKNNSSGALQYNLNIKIEPEVKLNVILDPLTSDAIQVQGSASINAGLAPDGSVGLTGVYTLKKGSYNLNYSLVHKRFDLKDGSTITFNGDPMQAYADITAVYEISTPPMDLIGNEVSSSSDSALYRRNIPFQVLLKIKGSVQKPQLSFDIVVKEKAEGLSSELAGTINDKLQQLRSDTSAMTKQVFALLVLNRFIGEQSQDFFASINSGNNNASLLANSSVSGFLNAAASELAGDLVKGVNIDVNLKNDNTDPDAQHTDLNVGISKGFFNDRLNVSFGKSFTVEGQNPATNGNNGGNDNTQYIPDVNTTYKLSKDGKYMLRVYRVNQYEEVMDGYFIETGLAFTFSMDYNLFKELFAHKRKK